MQAVFITGASSGLGLAIAREYAEQGARLALVGRRHDALQALRDTLPNAELHQIYALDVNDHPYIRRQNILFNWLVWLMWLSPVQEFRLVL